jgi:hypothetical protein
MPITLLVTSAIPIQLVRGSSLVHSLWIASYAT